MEERLFWIGCAVGAYAYATRYGLRVGKLESKTATGLWHALFCALAGFGITLVAVMYVEDRARFQPISTGIFSSKEFYRSALGALACGLWGWWSVWRNGKNREARENYHLEDLEWAETVFSAVLLAAFVMYFVVQAFKIPSGSMRSTLLEGDHLFVNKFIYGLRVPLTHKRVFHFHPVKRGDIIVFRFPTEDRQDQHCGEPQYGKDFIKRVIGLPGEEVRVTAGKVYVDGKSLDPEPYTQYLDYARQEAFSMPLPSGEYQKAWENHQLDHKIGDIMRDSFGPVRVPPGQYFVMGDNRDRSCDSRFWGPVPDSYIKGEAWLIYWPPNRMGAIR